MASTCVCVYIQQSSAPHVLLMTETEEELGDKAGKENSFPFSLSPSGLLFFHCHLGASGVHVFDGHAPESLFYKITWLMENGPMQVSPLWCEMCPNRTPCKQT